MLQQLDAFDAESWRLTHKYPRGIPKDMYNVKVKLVAAVDTYLKLPKDQRPVGAWLIENRESEIRKIGISRNAAAIITPLVWV